MAKTFSVVKVVMGFKPITTFTTENATRELDLCTLHNSNFLWHVLGLTWQKLQCAMKKFFQGNSGMWEPQVVDPMCSDYHILAKHFQYINIGS